MKIIAMIPARYAATRLPAKLMQPLGNKTVIRTTYDAVVATGLFHEVYVVTDSPVIYDEILSHNGKVIMSKREHESGSDRIAEAIAGLDIDVVINVQGDEPFITREPLEKLVTQFQDGNVKVASLMKKISPEEMQRPAAVKVVVNNAGNSLYFSRSPIPYAADPGFVTDNYLHVGVYGYRKQTLLDFTRWAPGRLEQAEKLEQLRYLENGVPLRMALVDFEGVAIDTPADLEKAREFLARSVRAVE
ncbi:MAG: 3-deoxy-manno-octulosonate cytidylyltransferase [Chitinophagaceae bacterium]|nr:MAG: 3-deoxy-manno-octulosonate cytidylyltransferase [Chitinophagaceae bacterium]